MGLRLRPLVDCAYGGMQDSKMSSCRVPSSTSHMSFCGSMRNPFLKQQHMMEMKKGTRPLITAVIKRRKHYPLDAVIQRQKKLKLVTVIKDLLIKEPGMVMSLKRLGRYRKKLHLQGKRRVVSLLKKYPAVFEVFEEGVNSLYLRLTQEAEDQVFEEIRLKADMESTGVMKIRKMLMMSINKTLLLQKIDHLKKDLGLPDEYREIMIGNYPQYFKVIETEGGPALELTSWDPELAISAWEKKQLSAPPEEDTISGRPRRFAKIDLPRGHLLKRKDAEVLRRFQQVAYVSPYADFAQYKPNSIEAEKHSCAVVHELLSLMVEKRTLVDHLTHFRKDYKFSQQLYGMIVRHPDFFYISLKGTRDCVFLREAYNGSELIEKDPLVLVKERLAQLAAISARRFYRSKNDSQVEEEDDDEDDENDSEYDEEGEDDGWSDDDDVLEEDSDDELVKINGQAKDLRNQERRKPFSRDIYARKPMGDQRGRAPRESEKKSQREPRRPLRYVLREQALAAQADTPREKW